MSNRTETKSGERSWLRWLPLLTVAVAMAGAPLAGSVTAATAPSDDTLRAGAEVFTTVCAQCHQAGGVGLKGQYPPLKDNPNVADAAYVATVIKNGRQGEIVVAGETYNGVMPAQSTLTDDQVSSVIAYIQSGFAAPAGPVADVPTGPVAGTQLPALADYAWIVAFLIAIGLGALALGPRVIAAHDRREITWLDAWMKTAVIVVGLIVSTTLIPAYVLKLQTVEKLPRAAQDVIAVGLWLGALGASAWALWYAHRERRV
jgi:mono/diheme cytochrome c family protein